jgi:hypothetical protein
MSRPKKDDAAREAMCDRLIQLLDSVYQDSDSSMADRLGYANSSLLYRVRQGLAFPDVERLERLVGQRPAPDVIVNLNWLVAGVGSPLLRATKRQIVEGLTIGEFIDGTAARARRESR